MEAKAVRMLDENRIASVATLRPDGWPQATIVSYANDGLALYFVISRASQKFANLLWDSRVSITVGKDFDEPSQIRGLSIAAHADEVRDPGNRRRAVELVVDRHPELRSLPVPLAEQAAVIRATPIYVTIADYSRGLGHTDLLTVAPGGVEMTAERDRVWGFLPDEV